MSASSRAADVRTAFLQDAAKSIATTSPSTASYIASESIQYNIISETQDKALTDQQRESFCLACGNVFVPGRNCSISRGDKISAPGTSKTAQRRSVVYHCQRCHHYTNFCLPSTARSAVKREEKNVRRSAKSDLDKKQQVSLGPTSKTNSKKRAKARRDRAGLQSLLNKSKEETTASPQLSLMDFMMT